MKLIWVIICLLSLSFSSAIASCSIINGQSYRNIYTISQSTLTVGKQVSNGTILIRQSNRPTGPLITMNCTSSVEWTIERHYSSNAVLIPSGLTGPYGSDIYKTNVPGLGFYMFSVEKPFPNSSPACSSSAVQCNFSNTQAFIALNLIQIGNIAAGSILKGSDLPCVNMSLGKGAERLELVESCFGGTLTINQLTCNTPSSINIDLGIHDSNDFTKIGSSSEWIDASISLTDCPPFTGYGGSTNVNDQGVHEIINQNKQNSILLRLSPISGVIDYGTGLLSLIGESSATGIGIQLASGDVVNNNTINLIGDYQLRFEVSHSSPSTVKIPLLARYVRYGQDIKPGTASSKIIYTIDYL